MAPEHSSEYDATATERCERVLVTLLGDIGPWGGRIVLVGVTGTRWSTQPMWSPGSAAAVASAWDAETGSRSLDSGIGAGTLLG